MRKRTLIPLLTAVAVLIAFGVMLYLRAKAPPEAARLLPESDAIVYVRLKTLRNATHLFEDKQDGPVVRSTELQQFIDDTGIVPERDIDTAAFALHKVPVIVHGLRAADLYTSEVFIGRFDGEKLAKYLDRIATAKESYAGRTVYTVPLEPGNEPGQTLRVAQLAYDTVAASNMPTPEQIHSMLDRSRASALGTPGSSLLAAHFHDVPLLSEAWGIGHIGLPFAQTSSTPSSTPSGINVMGLQLAIAEDSDLVASLRYTPAEHVLSGGAVQLRIEEFAPDALTARSTVATLNTALAMLRGISSATPPHNAGEVAMRAVLASTKLSQQDQRALLDASATLEQLKAIFRANDPAAEPAGSAPTDDTPPARKPCGIKGSDGKAVIC